MIELRRRGQGFRRRSGDGPMRLTFGMRKLRMPGEPWKSALESGKGEEKAFASLGQAILSAGLNDPGLDELRDEERDVADRMLNLQMQLRRMGGRKQVKKVRHPGKNGLFRVTVFLANLLGVVFSRLFLTDFLFLFKKKASPGMPRMPFLENCNWFTLPLSYFHA